MNANDTDNSGEQKFNNFKPRDYDFDSLEKKLLECDIKFGTMPIKHTN